MRKKLLEKIKNNKGTTISLACAILAIFIIPIMPRPSLFNTLVSFLALVGVVAAIWALTKKRRRLSITGLVVNSLIILATFIWPNIGGIVHVSYIHYSTPLELVTLAKADIGSFLNTALRFYELDNGNFPTTEEGLDALMSKPPSATDWNGPYLEKKLLDPWDNPYIYLCPGKHNKDSYDLYSCGPDGEDDLGEDDDIADWKQ